MILTQKIASDKLFRFGLYIIAVIFCLYLSKLIIAQSRLVEQLVIALIILPLILKKTDYGLFLLIAFTINFFGIYDPMTMPHMSIPSLGTLYISDFLLLSFSVHSVFLYSRRKIRITATKVVMPVYFLFGLIFFQVLTNVISGLDIHSLLNAGRHTFYFFTFFIILNEIESEQQMKTFLKALVIAAFITGVVTCFQFYFAWRPSGSLIGAIDGGIARVYQAGGVLVNACFLGLLSILHSGGFRGKINKIVVVLILFMLFHVGIVSFARSLWGSILLAVLFIIIFGRMNIHKKLGIIIVTTLLIIASVATVNHFTGSNTSLFIGRAQSGVFDLSHTSGTFNTRIDIIRLKWRGIAEENVLFGRGFDWGKGFRQKRGIDPNVRSADNSIANILLIFGITGIFVFVWIFVTVFKTGFLLLKEDLSPFHHGLVIGIMAFNFQALIGSFFGDVVAWAPGVIVLSISWGVLELVGRFRGKGLLSVT